MFERYRSVEAQVGAALSAWPDGFVELQELGGDTPRERSGAARPRPRAVLAGPDRRRAALVAARRSRRARLDVRGPRRRSPPSRAPGARPAGVRAVVCLARSAGAAEPARAVRVPAPARRGRQRPRRPALRRRAAAARSAALRPPRVRARGRARAERSRGAHGRGGRLLRQGSARAGVLAAGPAHTTLSAGRHGALPSRPAARLDGADRRCEAAVPTRSRRRAGIDTREAGDRISAEAAREP